MRLRDSLGIDAPRQRQITRLMVLSLVGMLFVGVDRREFGIVITTAIALGVTRLPALLERDYDLELDAGLTLWLTTVVFLHTLGVVGIPGTDTSLYAGVPFLDHVTHALSSSVVAGVGYTTVRALDEHSDAVVLHTRFVFAFVLLFVMAFGVFWELIEFGADHATTAFAVDTTGFTQHGLRDTMLDLVFDATGGVIVAAWGHAHLTDVVGQIERRLEFRRAN